MGNIVPNFKTLNLHPQGAKVSAAHTKADEAKDTSQERIQQKRTTHSYLSTPALEELTIPIIAVPSSKRKIATKSKEENMKMEFL